MKKRLLYIIPLIFFCVKGLCYSPVSNSYIDVYEDVCSNFDLEYSPQNAYVAQIPVQTSINMHGAAIINVPLELPDIGNGMKPDLTFSYNSSQPVSMFGNDWGLSGLSQIRRIRKSIYYDNIKQGVDEDEIIDGNEAFMLDHNRLIVTDNNFPKSVTYKSETGNIKVKAYFTQRKDALTKNKLRYVHSYFKVFYPNGESAVFGYEQTERSESLLHYPITRLTDILGRCVNYDYIFTYGEYRISRISFGNDREVNINFSYESKTIVFKRLRRYDIFYDVFRGGPVDYQLTSNCVLNRISIRYNNQNFRDYSFVYHSTENFILLTEIHLVKNKTKIPDNNIPENEDFQDNDIVPEENLPKDSIVILKNDTADFIMPLRFRYGENQASKFDRKVERINYTYLNPKSKKAVFGNKQTNGIVIYPTVDFFEGETCSPTDNIIIKPDLDKSETFSLPAGDGFVDILCVDLDNVVGDEVVRINNYMDNESDILEFSVYTFTADGTLRHLYTRNYVTDFPFVYENFKRKLSYKEFFIGDFDGNGKNEILAVSSLKRTLEAPFAEMYDLENSKVLYRDEIFADMNIQIKRPDGLYETAYDRAYITPGDYNGDGKTDLFYRPRANKYAALIKFVLEEGNIVPVKMSDDIDMGFNFSHNYLAADFNGDGLSDLYATGHCGFYLSNGEGLVAKSRNSFPADSDVIFSADDIFSTEDMNGDGQSDLTVIRSKRLTVYFFSEGKIIARADTILGTYHHNIAGGSFLGNETGKNELVFVENNELVRISYGIDLSKGLLITGVKSSTGVLTDFTYCTLKDEKLYSLTSDAHFPYQNQTLNATVVSKTHTYVDGIPIEVKQYKYENGVRHKLGLGFCGFEKVTVLDSIRNQSVLSVFDPYNFGVLKTQESPMQKTVNTYDINVNPNKTAEIKLTKTIQTDKLKSINIEASYLYDSYGNVTQKTIDYGGGLKQVNTNTYKNYNTEARYYLGELTSSTNRNYTGASNTYDKITLTWNVKGMPISKKSYYNGWQVSEEITPYDAAGNLLSLGIKSYSSNTLTKNYEYDAKGRVIKETDPMGLSVSYTYNDEGQLIGSTDIYGKTTRYEYDIFGQLVKTILPTGAIKSMEHRWVNIPEETAPTDVPVAPANARYMVITKTENSTGIILEPTTIAYYDVLGREIRTGELRFDDTWLLTDKVYDARGRLQKVSLPFKGNTTVRWNTYSYDSYDRPTSIIYASGKADKWSYSGNSITSTIDGIYSIKTYNRAGQLVAVSDPGGIITYNYRPDGQHSSIDVNGVITTFTYDSYGRKNSITDPSAGKETISYDAAGNVSRQTDAAGKTITLQYDSYHRPVTKTYPEFTTTYSYDAYGRLAAETSTNGTSRTFSYDAYGRVGTEQENVTDSKWLKKTYTYNELNINKIAYGSNSGSITSESFIYKNGHLVRMNNGYLSNRPGIGVTPLSLSSSGLPGAILDEPAFWQLIAENEMGMPVSANTGPITRSYGYNSYGYPTYRKAVVSGKSIFSQEYYFSASTGNLNYRDDHVHGTAEDFRYDNLNRLVKIQQSGKNISYLSNGNINEVTGVGSYEYERTDKPYALTGISTNDGLSTPHVENQIVRYTSFKRPSVIATGDYSITYIYNVLGERVRADYFHEQDGDLFRKYYIGGRYETDESTEILYLGGDAYSAPAVCKKEAGKWNFYYICRDYLGSICYITNNMGEKVQELNYDAWGQLRDPDTHEIYAPGEEPDLFLGRGYTGHEHLQEHGLINMNARLYDPFVGRFLSPDPYVQDSENTQNYNRYSYALNNPLKYTDPSGELYEYDRDRQCYVNEYGERIDNSTVHKDMLRYKYFRAVSTFFANSIWHPSLIAPTGGGELSQYSKEYYSQVVFADGSKGVPRLEGRSSWFEWEWNKTGISSDTYQSRDINYMKISSTIASILSKFGPKDIKSIASSFKGYLSFYRAITFYKDNFSEDANISLENEGELLQRIQSNGTHTFIFRRSGQLLFVKPTYDYIYDYETGELKKKRGFFNWW